MSFLFEMLCDVTRRSVTKSFAYKEFKRPITGSHRFSFFFVFFSLFARSRLFKRLYDKIHERQSVPKLSSQRAFAVTLFFTFSSREKKIQKKISRWVNPRLKVRYTNTFDVFFPPLAVREWLLLKCSSEWKTSATDRPYTGATKIARFCTLGWFSRVENTRRRLNNNVIRSVC